MIAIDTSSLIAYLRGDGGADVELVDEAFRLQQAFLPPVVLTELLSLPGLERSVAKLVREIPVLEADTGLWERAAGTRRRILSKKLRARLADTLIAQSCLDYGVPLITRDSDFRHFAAHVGLKLATRT
ncbi:MAG: PIN domain-containing protein [Acidobacteriota bacterium]